MKTLQQNIEQLREEQPRRNREVVYVEKAAVGKDLFAASRQAIMLELEDSELIKGGLRDEIEARLLEDNWNYVAELVRQARVADYVANGVEEWKAFEIVDAMLSLDTEKGVAGVSGIDAAKAKRTAQQYIGLRNSKYAAEMQKNVEQFGSAADGSIYVATDGDYFEKLSQTIKCGSDYKFAHPYTHFSPVDEAKLKEMRDNA